MRKRVVRQRKSSSGRFGEVGGILLVGVSAFIFLGLVSYDPLDISLHTAQPNDPPHNYIGLIGAWFSFFVFFLLGLSSFLIPFFVGILGVRTFWMGSIGRFWVWCGWVGVTLISFSCLLELQAGIRLSQWAQHFGLAQLGPGGVLGEWILRRGLMRWIGIEGSYILLYSVFLAAIVFLLEIRLSKAGRFLITNALNLFLKFLRSAVWGLLFVRKFFGSLKLPTIRRARGISITEALRRSEASPTLQDPLEPRVKKTESRVQISDEKKVEVAQKKVSAPAETSGQERRIQLELLSPTEYQLPPLKLLDDVGAVSSKGGASPEELKRNADILKTTLKEFGVDVELANITRGPVITRYELQPAPGVKVQKITGLSNDIALALKAGSVRVVAPIPGKAAVGIEVPNTTSSMVYLKELLAADEFKNSQKRIPLALGKDVSGVPIVSDLTEMPHLLIAGATGSGKSICISSIILNILFYATPDYIRFLLIDPKMVELSVFADIPHLAIPVITEPRKAAAGLGWLVIEMERRYKIFAEVGVRNIELFNEKVLKEKITLRSGEDELKPLPYIVVIIDELADIMLVASYEVENSIARLAQLSRAIGIHLILATQRPSVDVITGVIKANFPARISFQVSSKVDSRTVLDTIGAEKLLGKGDLLFMPPGSSKLIRAQGAYVRDAEIKRILEFIKGQKIQASRVLNPEEIVEKSQGLGGDFNQMDDETLLQEAIKVIRATSQASVSILQRKLRIGYSRAARIMDLLEERGVVGPYKGSKARDILIDIETQGG